MAKYIIDGYNLLFSAMSIFGDSREELIFLLDQYCAESNDTVYLVFDAYLGEEPWSRKKSIGKLKVIFTKQSQTADTYIIEHIKRENSPLWTVVSHDREILIQSKLARANLMSSRQFLRMIHQTKPVKNDQFKPTKTTRYDHERYLEAFSGKSASPKKHEEFTGFTDPELERLRKIFYGRESGEASNG